MTSLSILNKAIVENAWLASLSEDQLKVILELMQTARDIEYIEGIDKFRKEGGSI